MQERPDKCCIVYDMNTVVCVYCCGFVYVAQAFVDSGNRQGV